jgi:hypothetical protein
VTRECIAPRAFRPLLILCGIASAKQHGVTERDVDGDACTALGEMAMPPGAGHYRLVHFTSSMKAAGAWPTRAREAQMPATAVEAWDERWVTPEGRVDCGQCRTRRWRR